jgi:enolase
MNIKHLHAFEILDSRGNPTLKTVAELEDGSIGEAAVPSGASTGSHEAVELRDNDPKRYLGQGVLTAIAHVDNEINHAIAGLDAYNQETVDKKMIDVDGTENKSSLGANAILSASMAIARAAAVSQKKPLYQYVAELFGNPTDRFVLPIPTINVLNGGKHAIKSTDMQEYMLIPHHAHSVAEAIRMASETFHHLGKIIKAKGFATTVGDEGGYAPTLASNEEPFVLMTEAIHNAGYEPGTDISFGLDAAATSFYENGAYHLRSESRTLTTQEMVDLYEVWVNKYPLILVEDMFAEDDWDGFIALNQRIGEKIQTIGDDLYVTNVKLLQRGIDTKASNAILIKLNQIGTVWETIQAVKLAKSAGMASVVSHRSGETEDAFIADFVVGAGTGQIKTGSMSRSERIAKYNRLIHIEWELGDKAVYSMFPFQK